MNEYFINYYGNKYIIFFLIILWIIPLVIITKIIINLENSYFYSVMGDNILVFVIVYIFIMITLLILILSFGMKLLVRNVNAILFDDYLKMDNDVIYYKEIKTLNFNTINYSGIVTTGYTLKIKYNINKKINIVVFTGTSKPEKKNCETLLNFFNELNVKYNMVNN